MPLLIAAIQVFCVMPILKVILVRDGSSSPFSKGGVMAGLPTGKLGDNGLSTNCFVHGIEKVEGNVVKWE